MKDKTTKTIIFGPSPFDLIGTEQWLSDMAKEGWLFDKFSPFFSVTLNKEEPKPNRRYLFTTNSWNSLAPSDEQLDIYAASGWIFADSYSDFNLFYNDNPDAPVIFSEERDYKKNTRKYLWSITAILLWAVYIMVRDINLLADNSLHLMEDQHILTIILTRVNLVLCFAVIGALAAEYLLGVTKARTNSDALVQEKPYKTRMVMHAIAKIIDFAWILLTIVWLITFYVPNSKTIAIRDLSKYQDTHPVTLEEIDPDNAVRLQEAFNDIVKHMNADYECTSTTKSGLVFAEKKTIDYHVGYGEPSWIWFTSHYGEFKDADNAIPYILEELDFIDPNLSIEDIRIPSDTVDYLGYYMYIEPDSISFNQYVFAQKGNKIAIGEYQAGVEEGALFNPDDFLDLKALAHVFAEEVNEE